MGTVDQVRWVFRARGSLRSVSSLVEPPVLKWIEARLDETGTSKDKPFNPLIFMDVVWKDIRARQKREAKDDATR